jgi:hypothetical protein
MDDRTETSFFPIQVATRPDQSNFLAIREQQYADKCLEVLGQGKLMRFLLMDMQEPIVKLQLENDPTFVTVFTDLQDQKLGRDK